MRACRFLAFAFWSTISGTMRAETDAAKLMAFMAELRNRVRGPGRIYFAEDATAILHGWRSTTIDVDLKPDPEPPRLFEALAVLKDELDINVELASPAVSCRFCFIGVLRGQHFFMNHPCYQ